MRQQASSSLQKPSMAIARMRAASCDSRLPALFNDLQPATSWPHAGGKSSGSRTNSGLSQAAGGRCGGSGGNAAAGPLSTEQRLAAGVDEAGRGPLAGPVVAAAVILDGRRPIAGLADSKVLTAARREQLAQLIVARCLAWSVAWADAREIDSLNILQATHLAMRRAVLGLRIRPGLVEVDGNRLPAFSVGGRTIGGVAIVGGDAIVPAISAASIIAKVHRDRIMQTMDDIYPLYGFGRHKGYGTAAHRDSISRFGPCVQHRRSFRPISKLFMD